MEKFYENINIPALDTKSMQAVQAAWAKFNDKVYSIGELEEFVAKYAGMVGSSKLHMPKKKAMLIMCGDHGIAEHGVSAYPQEVTVQMITSYTRGYAGANVMAAHAKADVFAVDVGVKVDLQQHPILINKKVAYSTNDISQGPAMTEAQAIQALRAGYDVTLDLINQGYEMFVTAEMGIGNTTISACVASVFTGLDVERTVGRGAGIGDKRLQHKKELVKKTLEINKPNPDNALEVMAQVGGYEFAGMAGMIIACAQHRIPVFVDGVNATAAALIAERLLPGCKQYMLSSHLSAEIAHSSMLKLLELKAIVNADMRLGEGTGACLALHMLDVAINIYNNCAGE